MSLLLSLENHTAVPVLGILYVAVISILFIVIAIIIEKKKLPNR